MAGRAAGGGEPSRGPRPRSLAVVGGGTAGYFAALAVKRAFPAMTVTVVESPQIPIIGVGEATTTLMPPFLHAQLGLDVLALWKAVRPTFKLGIRFEWGRPEPGYAFAFPFGEARPIEAAAYGGDLHTQSLCARLMRDGSGPVLRGPDGQLVSLLPEQKLAYHLDNEPFVDFLARAARERGVRLESWTVDEVVPRADGDGIVALRGGGRERRYDVYVDATGFRSRLMGGALASPFRSYASSLFCDRAVVASVPQAERGGTHGAPGAHGDERAEAGGARGGIEPYTTAETMDAGWCWRIPVRGSDHRGYVFASSMLGEDAAAAEMRAKNPGLGEPRVVRFRSGRHEDFWRGNVIAVGNAYGFVEPLESSALHMVIVEIGYLLAGLQRMADAGDASDAADAGDASDAADAGDVAASANPGAANGDAKARRDQAAFARWASDAVGAHWDYLRWFLALHYRYNRRLDTPFWRAARGEVDVSGFDALLSRYAREGAGRWLETGAAPHGDPAFGLSGITTLLLGQQVPSALPPQPARSRQAWAEEAARHEKVARWALPHREALAALDADEALLHAFATSPRSWCTGRRERIQIGGPEGAGAPLIAG